MQVAALFSFELSTSNMQTFFLNLSAGPALNLILSAENDYEGYVSDVKSQVNDSGFLIIIGMGIGFKVGNAVITLDGRYENSFDTILKQDEEWQIGKLQAFYAIAGIAF